MNFMKKQSLDYHIALICMTVDITTKPDAVVKNDDNRLVDDALSHFNTSAH